MTDGSFGTTKKVVPKELETKVPPKDIPKGGQALMCLYREPGVVYKSYLVAPFFLFFFFFPKYFMVYLELVLAKCSGILYALKLS